MATSKRLPLPWAAVYANSDQTALFHPATPWMDASRVEKLRVTFEMTAKTSVMSVAMGYQTANVENSPDTAATIATTSPYKAAEGVHYADALEDIATATASKQLIRFGWLTKTTSGTAYQFARVSGVVDLVQCT